ncbi:glycoside hydrolase family protein [Polaribacter glomeratus]|uniref:Glycosyl hydrolase family 30 beta sandwich domain-containing protein n=1 Tax=Polaribacter glomeratus TaxID=102 RepID=A0A2S7WH66_9FLAO|nr:hypothetical protein [Polaribacter glomeratus]PQJ76602.1 hypothetical protein BTO16_11965 [Polaribacter glomeratus]TXD67559.1 hypothetical protein ESX12_02955 [Polaribacter glomeratus]
MKKITYILLLCVVVFSCKKDVEDEIIGGGVSGEGDNWFAGLDLPLADKTGYPYESAKMTTATLSINSSNTIAANNLLLGANFGGFSTNDEKEIVRFLKPVTVRFPSGVWANWYNWEKDMSEYDATDPYDIGEFHRGVMDTWANNNTKAGFPGLTDLHAEMGFNTIFTYNVNYDNAAKSVARLKDSEAKGFDVKYIELGNEQFWLDQRSSKTSTPIKYFFTVRPISAALKAAKPGLKISVPMGWRTDQAAYNLQIGIFSKTYFDAISLHKYIDPERTDPKIIKSIETYKTILTPRIELKNSTKFVQDFAPGKPVWLTEWGVSCGLNAASFLGQADAYMYLFENQDTYERAEWFGLTTALNPMYSFGDEFTDNGGRPEKSLRNMKKTGHGAVYEILRDVFEDSQIYETSISTRILDTGVNAVEAKAVTKNGKTLIFAVNKTVRSVPFRVKLDGTVLTSSKKHEALFFESLQDNKYLNLDQSALTLIDEGTSVIILPPLSVNKISL